MTKAQTRQPDPTPDPDELPEDERALLTEDPHGDNPYDDDVRQEDGL